MPTCVTSDPLVVNMREDPQPILRGVAVEVKRLVVAGDEAIVRAVGEGGWLPPAVL
jgi:hypothetical protein